MAAEEAAAERPAHADRRRVILLAGPSGSGKSTIVRTAGLPILYLDDFYKAGSDPTLPRNPALGIVDWDHPGSWDGAAALRALEQLCATGTAEVPVYDMRADGPTGTKRVDLAAGAVVAEGIFAPELVRPLIDRGLLADAIVVRRARWKNLVRRAARDLAQRRKPPATIVRRGLRLYRDEAAVVRAAIAAGCRPLDAAGTRAALTAARAGLSPRGRIRA